MKLAELILSLQSLNFGDSKAWKDEDEELYCYHDVMEFLKQWDVPDRVERVWFIAHNRPAVDRVKALVVKKIRHYEDFHSFALITESKQEVDESVTDGLLAPLAGKTIYIEVWYE